MKKLILFSLLFSLISFLSCQTATVHDDTKEQCTVSWINGETLITKTKEISGETFSFPEDISEPKHQNRAKYTFIGWNLIRQPGDIGIASSILKVPKGRTKLNVYAVYAISTYTVSWYYDNSLLDTQKVKYGTSVSYDKSPPKKASDSFYKYIFDGFSEEKLDQNIGEGSFQTTIVKDTILYVVFKRVSLFHEVKFYNDTQLFDTKIIEDGTIITIDNEFISEIPKKSDDTLNQFTFQGWVMGERLPNDIGIGRPCIIEENCNLYAVYMSDDYVAIDFYNDDESYIDSKYILKTEEFIVPTEKKLFKPNTNLNIDFKKNLIYFPIGWNTQPNLGKAFEESSLINLGVSKKFYAQYISLPLGLYDFGNSKTIKLIDELYDENYFEASSTEVKQLKSFGELKGISSSISVGISKKSNLIQSGEANIQLIGKDFLSNSSSVSSVILTEGIKHLSENAISNCESLGDIYLPNTIETISSTSFINLKKGYVGSLYKDLCKIHYNGTYQEFIGKFKKETILNLNVKEFHFLNNKIVEKSALYPE